ncbi:unnamed protein product (macronuclear) [Paramecium tetraurelia]|uniref:Uncharacterized protein n=1 Tax=Paramecium tetraurelia TaxID=5888 RepID=A0CI04_PARTE|nr:uncharacterized protein GSPATT00038523001 [Paramecium tetraurelia]CAK70421.1 unnamed protein product [Paramecium tetraurelia]|eukprot:XP_001437818.1 hypothetical protein (macronuclear) [Paramecium tetraurelia strain d4-2]
MTLHCMICYVPLFEKSLTLYYYPYKIGFQSLEYLHLQFWLMKIRNAKLLEERKKIQ